MLRPPRHIAFIMDGNGRWAKQRNLSRIRGHERGAAVLREVAEFCGQAGIEEVTFYALSTENYQRRPGTEIRALMVLLGRYLDGELKTLMDNNMRLRAIGRTEELPDKVRRKLESVIAKTAGNTGMVFRLALNYGSRREILDAVARLHAEVVRGERSAESLAELDENEFARYLYDPQMTDPDLLIRTAGEYRMSNFLLWQLSYSELYISDVAWPDFSEERLREAISQYQLRERKFGSVARAGVLAPEDGIA